MYRLYVPLVGLVLVTGNLKSRFVSKSLTGQKYSWTSWKVVSKFRLTVYTKQI